MSPRDPFLPPTEDVELVPTDPFLPPRKVEKFVEPEVPQQQQGFQFDGLIAKLLDFPINVPNTKSGLISYFASLPERLRMRGQIALAEQWAKHIGAINSIITNMGNVQEAKMRLSLMLQQERDNLIPVARRREWEAFIEEQDLRKWRAEEARRVEAAENEARIAEAEKKAARSRKPRGRP
jgi:hypothetical protein